MALLDQVIEMQKRGMEDSEISRQLQNQRVPTSEIYEALSQAKIKSAISPEHEEMQPSMMPPQYDPSQNQMQDQLQVPSPQQYSPEYSQQPQDQYYSQSPQAYTGQEYYPQQPSIDPDTISEIAEQVVAEKFADFKRKTGDLAMFRETIQDKVSDLDERLRRIENSIDKLQQAVIGRIGEFGDSVSSIHKDLENLHETTSKLMNPLIDNYRELKKGSHKK